MYLCHCNVVSDTTIRAVIAGGARDLDTVAERCHAGNACGGCVPAIEDLLAEAAQAIRAPDLVGLRQAARRRHQHARPHAVPAMAGRPAAS